MKSIRFGVVVIIVCGIAALLGRIQVGAWERDVRVLDTQREAIGDKIPVLRNLMDSVRELETGQRGYLLTDKEAYLEPYTRNIGRIAPELAELRDVFRGDAVSLAEIDEIENLVEAKRQELARTIELRQQVGRDAAIALVETGEGKRAMDALREKANDFVARLRRVRTDLGTQETRIFSDLSALGAVVLVLILLLVAAAVGWLITSLNRLDEVQRQRQREAMHDSLTGLPNRRYLSEWLNMTLAAARRGGYRVILLYFDLDGFKAVNDRLGHDAGDRVLQATAGRLRRALRTSDFVARLGGDEFVAVLPDAPPEPALSALLARLEHDLAEAPTPELEDGAVSASIGIAYYPEHGDSPDALLTAADREMYKVKEDHHAVRRTGEPLPDAAAQPATHRTATH